MEFKENLLEKSIKYMKSVVAFVNGTGGKIIFGIANKTREIVGFDKEDAFKKMDAIANAVSDSCEPAIIPDSTLQTVDGKTVIVVEILRAGQQLRSWGHFVLSVMERIIRLMLLLFWLATEDFMLQRKSHVKCAWARRATNSLIKNWHSPLVITA
mgnify:CR=1 FL=1